jgi:lysyl endopeptidase
VKPTFFFLALAASLACTAPFAQQMPSRAYEGTPTEVARFRSDAGFPARFAWPVEGKVTAASAVDDGRRRAVGRVRAAPKSFASVEWHPVAGGRIAHFEAADTGALGLRVRLDLPGNSVALDVRVQGSDDRVETLRIARGATEAWTPWTEGDVQKVEIFATVAVPVAVGAIVHFDLSLSQAKAAGACTIDTLCTTGDAALDAAIMERKKSMALIQFMNSNQAFVCTGTLLNTERFPAPYFLTANHCIGSLGEANSITSFWFYENTVCGSGPLNPNRRQVTGGMQIVFADPNLDQTLLLMYTTPPAGVTFSGFDATPFTAGEPLVSISHPAGDVSKYALATAIGRARFIDWEQDAWLVTFTKGIVQGGSSGSGIFTLTPQGLVLRSMLSATTTHNGLGLSCENTSEYGVYNRFDIFYKEMAGFIQASTAVADDHGNRPEEATVVNVGASVSTVTGRIDFSGDVDVFKLVVTQPGTLIARSRGGQDLVGVLLNSQVAGIAHNDDAQTDTNDFGLTVTVAAGTYYLMVTRWEAAGTGPYSLEFSLAPVTNNYTDLWWIPSESGWGINFNHQGNVIFATLFTYDTDGAPLWLSGATFRQASGTYTGDLVRSTGPAFNAVPFGATTPTKVGTMSITFPTADTATLAYTVNGAAVTKSIIREVFSKPRTTCGWSAFDRSYSTNFQDLWFNPNEPGWGMNITQQGNIIFVTLFTYDANGRAVWYSMASDARNASAYTGQLLRSTGPVFNAIPWTDSTAQVVGTMRVTFLDGKSATLLYTVDGVAVTKNIVREVFAAPAPECETPEDD